MVELRSHSAVGGIFTVEFGTTKNSSGVVIMSEEPSVMW